MSQPRPKRHPLTWAVVTVLIVVPFVALLWVPYYSKAAPKAGGFPFFYWYQLLWVPGVAVLSVLAYLLVARTRPGPGGTRVVAGGGAAGGGAGGGAAASPGGGSTASARGAGGSTAGGAGGSEQPGGDGYGQPPSGGWYGQPPGAAPGPAGGTQADGTSGTETRA